MSRRWFLCAVCNRQHLTDATALVCCGESMLVGRKRPPTDAARVAASVGGKRRYILRPEDREKARLRMAGSKQSAATIAKRVARNRGQKRDEEQKWNLSQGQIAAMKRDPSILEERVGNLKNARHRNPASHPGPAHPCAVSMWVRDPSGARHFVQNITHFVRTNAHLFAAEDVEPNVTGASRASKGLSLIRAHKYSPNGHVRDGARLGWKGWTLIE